MIIQKLFVYILVTGLIFQTTVCGAADKTPVVKDGGWSPDLKQNALKLLSSVSRETEQFRLAENRVRTRIVIADLMWPHDEAAARVVYQNTFTELRNLFCQINAVRIEELKDSENAEHYASRFRLAELRREYVLTLAGHDPAAAIDALQALKTKKIKDWDPLAEQLPLLKFETAAVMAVKDPDRAAAIYNEEFAAGGLTLPFVESLRELHQKNSELTAKIAKDIFIVIKTAKIGDHSSAGNATGRAAALSKPAEFDFWQVIMFLNAASKLKRRAERDHQTPAPLAEAEMRELAKLVARAFLDAPNPAKNTINQAMTAITLYAPDEVRRIREKVGADGAWAYQTVMESDEYYRWLEEKSADELALEGKRAVDPDKRDLLYAEAARKALTETKAERAQIIAARIKNRESYAALIEEIENAVMLDVGRRGHEAEVRKLLTRLKSKEKRIAVLLECASALAARGEREAAKKLLDETSQMLVTAPPAGEEESGTTLETRLEIAGKFAAVSLVVTPEEAFTNIETIFEAVNAEIKRRASSGDNLPEAKELFYDLMERELVRHVPDTIELLKNMAHVDFERTVKLLDKFERPEIRLLARLRLAQALLDPKAAAKEKEMRRQLLDELNET